MAEYTEENGKPKVDNSDSDKHKNNQQIIGLIILTDFKFDGDDGWEIGNIYDAESDRTYSCHRSLNDKGNLEVKGYIGI